MRTVTALVLALALLATACHRNAPATSAPAANAGDTALTAALHAYVVEFLRRNPTVNTYLGGGSLDQSLESVDGMLRNYSIAAMEQEDVWLAAASKTIGAIDAITLSTGGRIDREVALAQIQFMLHQHQVRHYQQRALDTYVSEPFRALDWQLQGMTQTGAKTYGTGFEWTLVVERLRAIPKFLAAAQDQLRSGVTTSNTPDARMLRRDGIDTAEANAKYFAQTLPQIAAERVSGDQRTQILGEITDASKQAVQAYEAFRAFVASTYFQTSAAMAVKPQFAGDRFAMGEAEYNWALKNNFRIDKTAAQLYEEAWPIVQDTQKQMIELARQVGTQHKWPLPSEGPAAVRAVFDQLSKDYPKSDEEMIGWYRDAAVRLVEYGRRTQVFDVPADYKLDVTQTPPPLEASIDGAAYYPAPPFKNSGVGRFYVTPTHNIPAALMANNRAALADLSAHEGFPGHDWHFKVMTQYRDRISEVRWLTPGAVEDSSAMWEDSMAAEGWALYSEALPAEPQPGAPNGFYTPEEHLYQLQGKLYRDLRVRIDTGIHTGRMTYADATTLFSEVVEFLPGSCGAGGARSAAKEESCASAERAIFRYSKWPTQAITYRLGKDQIYTLRTDASALLGARFSPKTFHLAFMRQGTIPAAYFHDALLSELQQQR